MSYRQRLALAANAFPRKPVYPYGASLADRAAAYAKANPRPRATFEV